MWNSLGSTWKSRSDSGEHWKGAPPFLSRQCFSNTYAVGFVGSSGWGGIIGVHVVAGSELACYRIWVILM